VAGAIDLWSITARQPTAGLVSNTALRSDTRSRAIVAGMQLISLLLELVNRFADPILGQAIES
jgi:hypothetical protein